MPTLVKGQIKFPEGTENFAGATVYLSIESIGMMDMPSTPITETVQHNVTYEGEPLNYSIEGDVGDTAGPFNLRVHLSRHQSDDVKRGDFINKRAYPVLNGTRPDIVDVQVELV